MTLHTAFFDAAQAALDCVCARMQEFAIDDEEYPGCPCRLGVVHGPPALDDCCDWECPAGQSHGQLTVHLSDTWPTRNFPERNIALIHPCAAQMWVAQLVVTMARCVPATDETGRPPQMDAETRSARVLAIDLKATLDAVTCCFTETPIPGRRNRRTMIQGVTSDASGGCGSYTVTVAAEAGVICRCNGEGS